MSRWEVTFEHLRRGDITRVAVEAPTASQAILRARGTGAEVAHGNATLRGLRAIDAEGNTLVMREPGVFVAPRKLPASCYGLLP